MRSHGSVWLGALAAITLWQSCSIASAAPQIMATGGWSRPITADDLVAGPGSDLTSTYESAPDATLIQVKAGAKTDWRVDVRKVDSVWDSGLALYVRRTGDGTGNNPITGGTAYQLITGSDAPLFSGMDDRLSVPLQYKLSGVSVLLLPQTYSAQIIFTVTGIW